MKKYKFQNRSQKRSQSCVPLNTKNPKSLFASMMTIKPTTIGFKSGQNLYSLEVKQRLKPGKNPRLLDLRSPPPFNEFDSHL